MGAWDLEPFDKYFYPPHPPKGFRKLRYYSQFFDCVEVNATFYNSSFTPAQSQRWLNDVAENPDFIFTVKLYRGFTHTFDATAADVKVIHAFLDPLAEAGKLGGLLIQFPYSFTSLSERRQYLMRLSRAFQPHRLFVEVRHNSWNTPLMYNFFQENKLHLVNVDLPQIRRHMPLTALASDGCAYFRMMGRNALHWQYPRQGDRYLYRYTEEELLYLVKLIEYVKAHTTFVVFHNDPEANSLFNGFQLRQLVGQKKRMVGPRNLVNAFPQLKAMGAKVYALHPLFAGV
jgi:uncharacterized protein YecE (DUF72 family)